MLIVSGRSGCSYRAGVQAEDGEGDVQDPGSQTTPAVEKQTPEWFPVVAFRGLGPVQEQDDSTHH